MVDTKYQSNAICVLCMLCCLPTVSTYTEKTIKTFGGASLSHCMQHAACIGSVNIPWILQKLLVSHTSFWQEDFLNISNHSLHSSFA